MVERPILTIPIESLAVDIVGSFPKCKGGVRCVLTTLCLATMLPDAAPLQPVTAKAVMEELWQIFSRMALPMSILTDQGSQLTGKLMHEVCQLIDIDKLQTTVYHRPQTNGALRDSMALSTICLQRLPCTHTHTQHTHTHTHIHTEHK